MQEALLEKNVRPRKVLAIDRKCARALSDDIRSLILEILSHKPMSAEEISQVLESGGHKKAVTTIRHHLDALRAAGLIEAAKMVEVRGALLKYYSPTVRAFSFNEPANLDDTHAKLVLATSVKLLAILRLIQSDKKFASTFAKANPTCTLCKANHFREYAAVEIISHALAKVMESKEYAEMLANEKDARTAGTKA